MKVRLCAAMTVAFFLCAVAAAQTYHIRVTHNSNLRETYSLEGAIIETAPAGATLQVVGKVNRWLKINRNGNELWMADWIDYTRVEDSGQTSSQTGTAAQIDNCCFLDRQCNSNQEWTDGYWAFQNGQCAAPGQPQPATPAQPVASAPATVDNCCFIDRQCNTDQEWAAGYWAYQNNQCPAAPAQTSAVAPSRPRIEGAVHFVRHVSTVLDWLESKAPEWYNYVISGMDLIVEVPIPDQGVEQTCTALAYTHERKVSLETCWSNRFQLGGLSARMDQLTTVAALGHEACHVHRYEAGFVYDSSTSEHEEFECRKTGMGAEEALDPYGRYFKRTFLGEPSLNVVRRYCSEGFRPELFCPTIQRLQGG